MSEPQLEQFNQHDQSAVGAALQQLIPEVIAQWKRRIRQALDAPDQRTDYHLENDLPRVLKHLAETLESAGQRDPLGDSAPTHGEVRFQQNFNLDELLIEYHVLRQVVLELLGKHLERALFGREVIAINEGIDTALRESCVAFNEQLARQLSAHAEMQAKYLSFLSHDLRGGLNGMMLIVELLSRDLAGHGQFAESLNDIDVMKRSILETVATMDRFLHAEKVRKELFVLNPGPIDLCAYASDLVRGFIHIAQQKKLTVRHCIPKGLVIQSDRDLLNLIMHNLISNAVKFTPAGEVTIEASTPSDAAYAVRLSVVDQGPGIDMQHIDELFQEFRRGETHGQPGSGLGLSIVAQASRLLGAHLSVQSEPGAGAAFHIDLKSL